MNYYLKLKSLKIKGFRGFKEPIELAFDAQLTVLIGTNASGKSAILDAIAPYLMYLRNEITNNKIYTFPVPLHPKKNINYDVNNESDELENVLTVAFETADQPSGEVHLLMRGSKNTSTHFENFEIPTDLDDESKSKSIENQQDILSAFTLGIYNARRRQVLKQTPVLVYYGCNSIHTDINEEEEALIHFDILDTYRESLESKIFNFKQLVLLLDRQQKISLQNPKNVNPFLKALEKALSTMLSDDDAYTYKNLRMEWGLYYDEMVIDKVDSDGVVEKLVLHQLSSGEKTLIGLVADLTRRLYLANSIGNPLEGHGIVLIDEVDTHLHPEWERKVLTKLIEIFPNIQFVVTTHSPLILSNFYSKHIISIYKKQIYGVRDTFGHEDADDMLAIMGVKSVIQQKVKQIHRFLRENKMEEAQKIRNTIVTEGTFTPLLEIDLFIQRKLKKAS